MSEQTQHEKTTSRKRAAQPETIWFEPREPEPSMFDVAGYRPIRNFANGRLEYEIPSSDVDRFETHHFIQIHRVVRKR